ncbi:MAG: hypothetical protein KJN64_03385 [Ignavibacteria bacterium]|nr:hypothetical protein [Ignavibacteria bacterium]
MQLFFYDITFDQATKIFRTEVQSKMKYILSIIIIILLTSVLFAQTDSLQLNEDEIQTLVDKIGVKLLLSDNQKDELSQLLSAYSSNVKKLESSNNSEEKKKELLADLDEKIQLLLDMKQKMKYEILKQDWLESIKAEEKD